MPAVSDTPVRHRFRSRTRRLTRRGSPTTRPARAVHRPRGGRSEMRVGATSSCQTARRVRAVLAAVHRHRSHVRSGGGRESNPPDEKPRLNRFEGGGAHQVLRHLPEPHAYGSIRTPYRPPSRRSAPPILCRPCLSDHLPSKGSLDLAGISGYPTRSSSTRRVGRSMPAVPTPSISRLSTRDVRCYSR